MSFIVTARKWRPQKFSEVVGQEHITTTLKNAIKNNRIAHAYLFTGPRGVGKTTTARILAKTLNCLNPKDNEPCNECEMCKSIQNSQSMDIIEIDGASNRGIDEIRSLRESVKYAPTRGKYKIYIIDEVHMLTKESFNAFLKTLEEPPAHSIFIFATTDVHKVPLTIISRCQRFDFRRIQLDTIKQQLSKIAKDEKIEIDDKTLTIIAKKSDGALRDAESFFDQIVSFCGNKVDSETVSKMLNLVSDEVYFTISDAIIEKNFKSVFDVTKIIYENGWNFIDFMDGLIEHFRNIMTVVLTQSTEQLETADVYRPKYMDYIDKYSEGDILRILNFLNKTQQEMRFAQNQKLKIEISLSHLIGLEKTSTISDIISQIESKTEPADTKTSTLTYQNSAYTTAKPSGSSETPSDIKPNEPKEKNHSFKKTVSIKPSTNNENKNFSLETIQQKWEGFVDAVLAEKGLIFGPFLEKSKLVSLEGNVLKIFSEDEHGEKIIESHADYIAKKTLEYFGRKISFEYTLNSSKTNKIEMPELPKQKKQGSSQKVEDDPIVNLIINHLGGEEIL
jgi:DNA polymerase III subunit gamma/tau